MHLHAALHDHSCNYRYTTNVLHVFPGFKMKSFYIYIPNFANGKQLLQCLPMFIDYICAIKI